MDKQYMRFFGGVEPVRGINKSLIYDLHREAVYEIPTLLFDVIEKRENMTIEEIKSYYNHVYDEGINLYLNQLFDLELVFFTQEKEQFPRTDYSWDSPLHVTNTTLEVVNKTNYNVKEVLSQLDHLGCAWLQFRFLSEEFKMADIKDILNQLKRSRLKIVDFYIPYTLYNEQEFNNLFNEHLRLNKTIFYGAPEDRPYKNEEEMADMRIIFLKNILSDCEEDFISKDMFVYNIKFFSEAQQHNVALNRSISIDQFGNFKNYLSHNKQFGNANNLSIHELLKLESFKQKWFIKNDDIEKCKDCQNRYACLFASDIKVEDGKYVKTQDCGYDPYKNIWKEL
ncbi:MAG: grasp-with-spasm system SPASM domain peptide maturase [Flavobacteriales bacterium]|nr:grasp-with-spasm system SPASM domain peptide maturase [Flavobacteriales bacterium]